MTLNCAKNYISETYQILNYSCPVSCSPTGVEGLIYSCGCRSCEITGKGWVIMILLAVFSVGLGWLAGQAVRRMVKE